MIILIHDNEIFCFDTSICITIKVKKITHLNKIKLNNAIRLIKHFLNSQIFEELNKDKK